MIVLSGNGSIVWGTLFGEEALKIYGLIRTSWHEPAEQLKDAGYQPPADNPGYGAVLACHSSGEVQAILEHATRPQEHIAAIQSYRPVR